MCIVFDIDFLLLADSWVVARVERGLKGITIENTKFFEHDEPTSAVLFLFVGELAIVEGEALVLLVK